MVDEHPFDKIKYYVDSCIESMRKTDIVQYTLPWIAGVSPYAENEFLYKRHLLPKQCFCWYWILAKTKASLTDEENKNIRPAVFSLIEQRLLQGALKDESS